MGWRAVRPPRVCGAPPGALGECRADLVRRQALLVGYHLLGRAVDEKQPPVLFGAVGVALPGFVEGFEEKHRDVALACPRVQLGIVARLLCFTGALAKFHGRGGLAGFQNRQLAARQCFGHLLHVLAGKGQAVINVPAFQDGVGVNPE